MKKGIVSLKDPEPPSTVRRTRLLVAFRKHRFLLAAFLIPLGIRAIPEILVGPYPIGWDTIAFYVPNTLDWAAGKAGLAEIVGTAPLMYMISVPAYLLSRVNPVWIFKIMGPVLYGIMIGALFRFLRIGLKWPDKQALGGALLTSLYFVTLRVSWDMYRNMLGLTFILLSLPLLQNGKGPRTQPVLSVLLLLAVASDQLTAAIAAGLIGARAVDLLRKRAVGELTRLASIGIPSVALFSFIVYMGRFASGQGLVQTRPAIPRIEGIWSSVGFLVYVFLPLLPFAAVGIRRTASFELRSWTVFCAVANVAALLPFYGLVVDSYRWALLLDIPICVFAASGVASVGRFATFLPSLTHRILRQTITLASLSLLLLSVLYVAVPAQEAFQYYMIYPDFVPTSMLQNSVPLSDMANLRGALNWVAAHMGPDDALITHQAIYGWAKAYLPSTDHIVNYEYSNPLDGVSFAISSRYSSTWAIWWTPGLGWHGQTYFPSGFVIVFQNGDIAVYVYH